MRATGKECLRREEAGRAAGTGAGCTDANGTGNGPACAAAATAAGGDAATGNGDYLRSGRLLEHRRQSL